MILQKYCLLLYGYSVPIVKFQFNVKCLCVTMESFPNLIFPWPRPQHTPLELGKLHLLLPHQHRLKNHLQPLLLFLQSQIQLSQSPSIQSKNLTSQNFNLTEATTVISIVIVAVVAIALIIKTKNTRYKKQ
jgi:hypothetical protein